MNKKFLFLTLGILCCGTGGTLLAESGAGHHHHDHGTPTDIKMEHGNGTHHHHMVVVPEGESVPEVDLTVYPDTKKGWNLKIELTNFTFAPEQVNQANRPNEGHGHLYVNGEKITRIYGDWYYLEQLPLGKNEIKVSLNTNDHGMLMSQGKMIEDTEIVTVE